MAAFAGSAFTSSAASAAELAGTTSIASPAAGPSGYVRVELPRPQTFELCCGPQRMVAFRSGGGRLAGFLLQQERTADIVDAPGIFGIRTAIDGNEIEPPPPADQLRLGTVGDTEELSGADGPDWKVKIPAGTYRLYLFAEAPVRITLALPGLPGSASLAPTSAVGSRVAVLDRRPLPAPTVAVQGASHRLDSGGFVYSEAWHTIVQGATRIESCIYPPGSDGTAAAAYGPGCPGGESEGALPYVYDGEGGYAGTCCSGYTSLINVSPGDWGVGGNLTQMGAPAIAKGPDLRGIAVWVEREGTVVPPTAGPPTSGPPTSGPPSGTTPPEPVRPTAVAPPARLPSLVRRGALMTKRGLRIRLRCRGKTPCVAYASVAGEKARLVRIRPGATRAVVLPGRRVGRRAVVVLRSLRGDRSTRRRVIIR